MEYMAYNYVNEMHDMRLSFAVAVLVKRYGGMLSRFDFFKSSDRSFSFSGGGGGADFFQ